jgi:hypothetical protein
MTGVVVAASTVGDVEAVGLIVAVAGETLSLVRI